MRPDTVRTDLQLPAVLLFILKRPRTVFHIIERAVAEETVDLLQAPMAGIELTFRIGKEAIGIHAIQTTIDFLLQIP